MNDTASDHDDFESDHWSSEFSQRPQRLTGGADTPSTSDTGEDGDEVDEEPEELAPRQKVRSRRTRKILQIIKITLMVILWLVFTSMLMTTHDHHSTPLTLSVPVSKPQILDLPEEPASNAVGLRLSGPFELPTYDPMKSAADYKFKLSIVVQQVSVDEKGNVVRTSEVSQAWHVQLVEGIYFDTTEVMKRENVFQLFDVSEEFNTKLQFRFTSTNVDKPVPLHLNYEHSPVPESMGIIYAGLILSLMYILLIWNVVHRTLAAVLACTLSIAILGEVHARPPLDTIISWIDTETLILIFGVTTLMGVFVETGIVDYLAVLAYKLGNGHIWPLINCWCLTAAIGAIFFHNISTIIMLTPLTIRLCELMQLNPRPVLMCLILSVNLGSSMAPTGKTPNDDITKHGFLIEEGVNFIVFIMHIVPGILLTMMFSYGCLRIQYHNSSKMRFTEATEVERLRRVIKYWKNTAATIGTYSKDEESVRDTVMSKVKRLRRRLRRLGKMPVPPENYEETLQRLKDTYPIRDKHLLRKSCIALGFVMILFLLFTFTDVQYLSLGWIALMGALMLLIMADTNDMEIILHKIEWSTLLFLAAIFILMETLTDMGVHDHLCKWIQHIVMITRPDWRLAIALLAVLWITGISSALMGIGPVSLNMIQTIVILSQNSALNLPLHPLVWALTLGACLGGNGTLIGACSNVVCVGISEKHGYAFSFLDFIKIGLSITIGNLVVASIYLMVVHVAFQWH